MRHSLRVERDGPVAHIVLTGPGKGNAMGPATWTDLPQAFAELEADRAVRAVILSGHGEHFSFGLDLPAMLAEYDLARERGTDGRRDLLALIERMQAAFSCVQQSRLPVIAAIAGWCIGSGLELACACDLRYAQNGARFSLREVRLGIVADLGGLARLPAIVGQGRARELALTGADFDAAYAARAGLVNDAVPEVIAHAVTIARTLAAHAPDTVDGIKRVMNAQQAQTIADGLRYVAAWNAAFLALRDRGGRRVDESGV